MLKKIFFFIALVFLSAAIVQAQVTTSGITGTVKGSEGSALSGATIKATHTPSGSEYSTATSSSGVFSLQGLRTGGPYTVEISYVGFPKKTVNEIYLILGESFVINETLGQEAQQLEGVVVTTAGGSRLNRNKTGASTNISTQQINTLPTINRSITDFTRLTPQSNGNSFAGRDGRYNNVQVDGANFNNGFGLNDNPLPGGGGLSIDAIEEIQVNIAPYDVRQGGFTGAGINAVTRSGTNKFQGSVYHFFRNEGLLGRKVNGEKISGLQESSTKTWGARLGGPIIRN
ncbi:MAG TPA: carboxypeptidase regulatory-like domain-containing protein, partial [Niabella sp.]|nr:carboxypeptidase regulatory-like domain-containing protein [Niabella sp.]